MAGMRRQDMPKHLAKADGQPVPVHCIDKVIAARKADPEWTGQAAADRSQGRPCKITASDRKALVDLVFRERGKAKVTIAYCRKILPRLRRVHRNTVSRYLHAAGLEWLMRRRKSWVPAEHKELLLTAPSRPCEKDLFSGSATFPLIISGARRVERSFPELENKSILMWSGWYGKRSRRPGRFSPRP